jgi:hypothetical protein
MTRTIAEALRDEGRQEGTVQGLRQALLHQLRTRFGQLPRTMERTITAATDEALLQTWLTRVLTATSLGDMGIIPPA